GHCAANRHGEGQRPGLGEPAGEARPGVVVHRRATAAGGARVPGTAPGRPLCAAGHHAVEVRGGGDVGSASSVGGIAGAGKRVSGLVDAELRTVTVAEVLAVVVGGEPGAAFARVLIRAVLVQAVLIRTGLIRVVRLCAVLIHSTLIRVGETMTCEGGHVAELTAVLRGAPASGSVGRRAFVPRHGVTPCGSAP